VGMQTSVKDEAGFRRPLGEPPGLHHGCGSWCWSRPKFSRVLPPHLILYLFYLRQRQNRGKLYRFEKPGSANLY
jgi:hypothetical protein